MSIKSALKKLLEVELDFIKGERELTGQEARFMVDLYYQFQEYRKATANQIRSLGEEPHTAIEGIFKYVSALEEVVKTRLEPYVLNSAPGRWMMDQPGIGPVLAANMLAHLDITKAKTAGAFWRFAGFDPTCVWNKGERRPHNARLKTACWKLSDSWVKLGTRYDSIYARLYRERKALEIERNDAGRFVEVAKQTLEQRKIGRTTDTYKAYAQGRLPDGRIDARARRYAVKLFLAHLHQVMYEDHYGKPAPKPYIFEHGEGEHVHLIEPPNWSSPLSSPARTTGQTQPTENANT